MTVLMTVAEDHDAVVARGGMPSEAGGDGGGLRRDQSSVYRPACYKSMKQDKRSISCSQLFQAR